MCQGALKCLIVQAVTGVQAPPLGQAVCQLARAIVRLAYRLDPTKCGQDAQCQAVQFGADASCQVGNRLRCRWNLAPVGDQCLLNEFVGIDLVTKKRSGEFWVDAVIGRAARHILKPRPFRGADR